MRAMAILGFPMLALACPRFLLTDAMRAADDVHIARVHAKIERAADPENSCRWAELDLGVRRTIKGVPGSFVTASAPNHRCMCTLGVDLTLFEPGKEVAVFLRRYPGTNVVLYAASMDREPWLAFLTPMLGSRPMVVAARLANRAAEALHALLFR